MMKFLFIIKTIKLDGKQVNCCSGLNMFAKTISTLCIGKVVKTCDITVTNLTFC